ncbi:MAG TPA: helix-turn-helix domain-containing GNAT family N-acetyltransferase [Acidobacteriaceae bacterium]|nr:helix-turn-helix domain-containing GNAT family N-acetyltransferase [Acidobacteriaceae bacterium]
MSAAHITSIRGFNRFYTAHMGLLRKRHLGGDFSLTEARILYEIGSSSAITTPITASVLRNILQLDAGYISRVLALLTKRKLIRQAASKHDACEKLLTLTPTGQVALEKLNRQSELHIEQLLANLPQPRQEALVDSLARARSILEKPAHHGVSQPIGIRRLSKPSSEALDLLHEYYEAVHVVQRDTPKAVGKVIRTPASGLWLAYLGSEPIGCVLLRRLSSIPHAGECKRLYVRPSARGLGIAARLMDALEDFAASEGLQWIYLDSYSDLKAAIDLYRRRGYTATERYNDNPQATIFLRKHLKNR